MSTVSFILGESGVGKTSSLRNLDPKQTLLIQCLRKPLPFRAEGWAYHSKESSSGNIFVADDSQSIIMLMTKTRRQIIVLDDFSYSMTNNFMRRSAETGYLKFTEIARAAWDIVNAAMCLDNHVRVYIIGHTNTTEDGITRIKTVGKLLDEKVTLEGYVTIVLRAIVVDQEHYFLTKNNGHDTVKTPLDMFEEEKIPNDLKVVDEAIVKFYNP